MIYSYATITTVSAEIAEDKKGSTIRECEVEMVTEPGVGSNWYDRDNNVTADGLKASTVCLINGLAANIHYGQQRGLWDSAEQLRYIIHHLEQTFALSCVEAGSGEGHFSGCKPKPIKHKK